MLFTSDGWVAARDGGKSDLYLFAYGLDYRAALKAFYTVSGKTPLVPRWALGNWWSRYCELPATSLCCPSQRICADD
jgi:alpha-glucosidase (family GH31 glycosyl hydrolase)